MSVDNMPFAAAKLLLTIGIKVTHNITPLVAKANLLQNVMLSG